MVICFVHETPCLPRRALKNILNGSGDFHVFDARGPTHAMHTEFQHVFLVNRKCLMFHNVSTTHVFAGLFRNPDSFFTAAETVLFLP